MSGAAEGTAKRGFCWISPREGPLHDSHLMSEFRRSHPLHADILENSIEARKGEVMTGFFVGMAMGCQTSCMLRDRLFRRLPAAAGLSSGQVFVRTFPIFAVCFSAGTLLGAHVGDNWGKGKNPHEVEAKFHQWLQNRDIGFQQIIAACCLL